MSYLRPSRFVLFSVLFLSGIVAFSGCGKGKNPSQGAGAIGGTAALPKVSGDWTRSGEPRVFNAENLWEYVDGGAEGYLIYDFKSVATADYQDQADSLEAVVDIYSMGNDLCGYGIYSSERPYQADYLQIGCQGYFTGNALNFWQGSTYVKITSPHEGGNVEAGLEKLARAVLAEIGGQPVLPPELEVFPPDNLIPNSIRYLARDVLGQSDLKNGFTAEYKTGDTEYKLFFILHDSPAAAQASLESYKTFMSKYGKNVEDHTGDEVTWFSAEDPYYGKIVAMQAGKSMLGVLGLQDAETVNDYLNRMQVKLAALGHI